MKHVIECSALLLLVASGFMVAVGDTDALVYALLGIGWAVLAAGQKEKSP